MNTDKITVTDLFDLNETAAEPLLKSVEYPWEVLKSVHDYILKLGSTLSKDLYDRIGEDVWIAKSAKVFDSAYIHGACIIGENTEIRQCAFIRGDALVGNSCVIGNSVELKNVIIFNNCEVPHYNYVGDSVLGFHAHMGAGSITSNIRSDRKNIIIHGKDRNYETGLRKIGAILGDYAEVGCNAVLNPGSVVGSHSMIYPTTCVRGVIPENSILTDRGVLKEKKE